jgi:hypothetical protein
MMLDVKYNPPHDSNLSTVLLKMTLQVAELDKLAELPGLKCQKPT